MISAILLSKLAHDAGFDVELGEREGWLQFRLPGRQLRAWLRAESANIVVALSRNDVFAELQFGTTWSGHLPRETQGARVVSSAADLVALLARARVLDRTLPDALLAEFHATPTVIERTEAEALVRQRRGQELFRKGLLEYWSGRCAITGIDVPELLRASHAKPWKDATDAERLDVYNGLLLVAHLDAAYDKGLITVHPNGRVEVSRRLSPTALQVLGLDQPACIPSLKGAHSPFLEWHIAHVFADRNQQGLTGGTD
ncbi:HNH endonuclease [Solimonas soli]|uniref:HNH endonuclease n=1 Tax=Solimonas soli TaxID=413479 RepID=UPI0012FADD7D|nr:HNH endonuclease [Solimonas soli]